MTKMEPITTSDLYNEKEIRAYHVNAILNAVRCKLPDDKELQAQLYFHYLQHQEHNT